MFNPNAMMGGGGQQGQNPGGTTGQSQPQQQSGGTSQTGTGSGTSSSSFDPNNPVGGSSGQTGDWVKCLHSFFTFRSVNATHY